MQYVITDGSRFIYRDRNGRYVPTGNQAMADIFNKNIADAIYKNSLSKALKSVFRVEPLHEPPKDIKPVVRADIANTEKVMGADNIQKWLDKVSDLNGLASDAHTRKEVLTEQLSEVDKELSDLLHYCEFCNLNAAQGYKAYKMIKERRIIRRTIKNELIVLNIILGKRIGESVVDEITRSVAGLDNRHYEPRVLKELFNT